MKNEILKKQQRQLRSASKNLQNAFLRRGRRSRQEITSLLLKIKRLSKELIPQMGYRSLAKMLGITAVYLGSSFMQQLSAQITFGPKEQNPFGITIPNTNGDEDLFTLPVFGDLDGDGDFDFLAGDYGKIRYYENTGTINAPEFATGQISPFGISVDDEYTAIPTLVDIDDDGDLDLFLSSGEFGIGFVENIGTSTDPQFTSLVQQPFGISDDLYYSIISFVDVDDDGDLDLLGGQEYGGFIFSENVGTPSAPSFGALQENPFGLSFSSSDDDLVIPVTVDLDNDGDFDVLAGIYDGSTETYEGGFRYYENIGTVTTPDFSEGVDLPFGLTTTYYFAFPAFADIDNDGDQDLFVGEYYGNIQYFENTTIVTSLEALPSNFPLEVFPNPMQNMLNIKTIADITRVELFNVLGQCVLLSESQEKNISLPELAKGLYEAKITLADGNFAIKKLMKN